MSIHRLVMFSQCYDLWLCIKDGKYTVKPNVVNVYTP